MRNKIFAVIDTNVLVSALISKKEDSPPLQIIKETFHGRIIPIYNDEIIDEYREVLSRDKFGIGVNEIDAAIRVFTDFGLKLERTKTAESFTDTKDIVFYEVKMSKDDSYLVTGNIRHFPHKPFIVTPKELIDILTETFYSEPSESAD